jgi:hypothetical protein
VLTGSNEYEWEASNIPSSAGELPDLSSLNISRPNPDPGYDKNQPETMNWRGKENNNPQYSDSTFSEEFHTIPSTQQETTYFATKEATDGSLDYTGAVRGPTFTPSTSTMHHYSNGQTAQDTVSIFTPSTSTTHYYSND